MTNTTSQPGSVDAQKAAALARRTAELKSIERLLYSKDIAAFLILLASLAVLFFTVLGVATALEGHSASVAPVIGYKVAITIFALVIPLSVGFLALFLFVRSLPKRDFFTPRLFARLEKYNPSDTNAYSLLQTQAAQSRKIEDKNVRLWLRAERLAIQYELGSPLLGPQGHRFVTGGVVPGETEQATSQHSHTPRTVDLDKNTAALKLICRLAKKYANHPLPFPILAILLCLGALGFGSVVSDFIPDEAKDAIQSLPVILSMIVLPLCVLIPFLASALVLRFLLQSLPAYQTYRDAIFAELIDYQPVDREAYALLKRQTEKAADIDYDGLQKWLETEQNAIQIAQGRSVLAPEGARFITKKV